MSRSPSAYGSSASSNVAMPQPVRQVQRADVIVVRRPQPVSPAGYHRVESKVLGRGSRRNALAPVSDCFGLGVTLTEERHFVEGGVVRALALVESLHVARAFLPQPGAKGRLSARQIEVRIDELLHSSVTKGTNS